MKSKIQIPALILSCCLFVFSGSDLFAQGKGKGKDKNKEDKVYKVEKENKEYKEKKDYTLEQDKKEKVYKDNQGKVYKDNQEKVYKDKEYKDKAYKGKKGKDKGRKFAHATPHNVKVPPGHYPPAGHYRVWYPNRPPGHQPAPVRNGNPPNAPLTDGAFILYGDKAYDTEYDWRQAEVQKKKSVPREIIDILIPGNTVPAQ